ncbi:hypothetical protein H0266_14205 [Halobacillus locisalis]|uniref:Uncharacterized protein n=1 Tax=Halobacillus locisalis TaxID=220753 RepID=A0A838CWQ7_9BACI|nr:hypothetical protein [Halobacillus locisalis]MBA2176046.1 hypothetical protein [Halobacillus locisalis]
MKKFLVLLSFFLLVSCNSQSYDHNEVREKASFKLWLPKSLPDTFQLEKSNVEDDSVFVRFVSGDKWIEMYQHEGNYSSTQTELKKYIESSDYSFDNEYEVFETTEFIGFLNKSLLGLGISDYIFANKDGGNKVENYYKVNANLGDYSFDAFIESLN